MKRGASAIAPWEPRHDVSRQARDERRRTDGRGSPSIYLGLAVEEQDRQGSRYEQEDLRVYESEVALFFHGALGGRCVGRACVKRGGGASDLSKRGRRPPRRRERKSQAGETKSQTSETIKSGGGNEKSVAPTAQGRGTRKEGKRFGFCLMVGQK